MNRTDPSGSHGLRAVMNTTARLSSAVANSIQAVRACINAPVTPFCGRF